MTSNQLAYQANKIEQFKADESVRHNQRVEDETNEHDRVTESIAQDANDLTQKRDEENARHNKAMESIQSEYNKLYIELQYATAEKKFAIEQQLADLETRKEQERERHSLVEEKNVAKANEIAEFKASEDSRHNSVIEGLNAEANSIKAIEAHVSERRQQAEAAYWDASIAYQNLNSLRNYNVNMYNANNAAQANLLGAYKLKESMREWDQSQGLRDTQMWSNIASGVGSIFSGASKALPGLGAIGTLKIFP